MDRNPVRVLQIVDSLGMGGAETWLMEVIRLWASRSSATVDFLLTSGRKAVFDDEARLLGSRLHYLQYGRRHFATFVREFRQILRRGRYDAIHDHQGYISGWHFVIGTGLLPPVRVAHIHNAAYQLRTDFGATVTRRCGVRLGKAFVSRFATHITGTSRHVMLEYGYRMRQGGGTLIAPLYCGFDAGRFRVGHQESARSLRQEFGWSTDTKAILSVGRMDPSPDFGHPRNQKNSGFGVAVAIECARRDPRFCMLVVGERQEPTATALERRVHQAGLSGRILFLDVRRDIERLMLGADILLFPSRGEGLGMAAVEAQAAGLPVLVSKTVPTEIAVVPGLVSFQELDAGVSQWASEVLRLVKHQPNRTYANDRVAASPFAIEHSARALLRLYREGELN
jgi:glycosyltransferase EpsF